MEGRAVSRFVRMSPRKVRLVTDLVRGKRVDDALATLRFVPRRASVAVGKTLRSAVANAVHNFDLDEDLLVVTEAYVDEGPTLKRWRARARGMASQIMKRTSHITIVVKESDEGEEV